MKVESTPFPESSTVCSFGNVSKANSKDSTSSESGTEGTAVATADDTGRAEARQQAKKKLRLKSELSRFDLVEVIGRGAFGVVFKATRRDCPDRLFAIKRLPLAEDKPKREVDICSSLDHPNCIRVLQHFVEAEQGSDRRFVNLVMDFYPFTLCRMVAVLAGNRPHRPFFLRAYAWQLCEAVRYLHSRSICHRDIKPQNILVDYDCLRLVLSDFGSAKVIADPGHQSTAYVCSRFYRAPELLMGEEQYGLKTDMWSVGCVLAELVLGRALFEGRNSKDQFVKIMLVLGSPSAADLKEACPNIRAQIPDVKGVGLGPALGDCDALLLDLIANLLAFNPGRRLSAEEALAHPFFSAPKQCRQGEQSLLSGNLIDTLRGQ